MVQKEINGFKFTLFLIVFTWVIMTSIIATTVFISHFTSLDNPILFFIVFLITVLLLSISLEGLYQK